MRGALTAIAAEFEKTHDAHVTIVAGPAGALHDRIVVGEPFDIYATAAFPQAQSLTEKGLARASVVVARNTLCGLVRGESPITTETLIDTMLHVETRLGTSTPKSDPAGDYTWALFRRIDAAHPGAFDALTGRSQMLFGGAEQRRSDGDPVARGLDEKEIDVVFLYCSGARSKADQSTGKYRAVELPAPFAVIADYGLTLTPRGSSLALDFFLAVLAPPGQATLAKFGFQSVASPSP